LAVVATREEAAENPLLEGLRLRRTPDPCALVIFGASGDLTKRKLFPALYSLALRRLLPERFGIIGVARTEESDDDFREGMKAAVQEFGRDAFQQETWDWLAERTRYVATDFADEGGQQRLVAALNELDEEQGTSGNRVYYLAVPPSAIATLIHEIGEHRSTEGWTRLIVEKPFGRDLASAQELNAELQQSFEEREVFRIDHYLGKETVQNLLALRFANGIFEPIWNRQFVDHVQITVAEAIGIEGRSAFYEQAGAIRDIFQNHLLQLVALTAMEPPIDFTAESVRNEKVKVLRAMHTPGPKHVVRGQYGQGFIEGEEVPGYRDEPGVARDSMTETFVAAKLFVDNWRWADTPFYVRAGKRLPLTATEVVVEFRRPPLEVFGELVGSRSNHLRLRLSPDMRIALGMRVKVAGEQMVGEDVELVATDQPGEDRPAYERLLGDALEGDGELFAREDTVEAEWQVVEPILGDAAPLYEYEPGTWGPEEADQLRTDGGWSNPTRRGRRPR